MRYIIKDYHKPQDITRVEDTQVTNHGRGRTKRVYFNKNFMT